jgi:hypothetical protein
MQTRLFRKDLIIGIIVVFIGIGFIRKHIVKEIFIKDKVFYNCNRWWID